MAQATLSLCMIVKNEEEMLPGLLTSVEGLWDEFIVADTGSTDNTLNLLRTAGAIVISHPWQDDFSAARNASLEPATSDWVLFLDADERLTGTLVQQIKGLLDDDQAGAATMVLRNDLPGGLHNETSLLRLFRNDTSIRFQHRIHEDISGPVLAYLAQTGRKMMALSGIINHLGYVREVAAGKDKKARDLALLEKSVAQNPLDFYCWFKILEQARFWDDRPLWRNTATRALAQWDNFGPEQNKNPWSGELASLLSQGLFDNAQESLEWLEEQGTKVVQSGPYHIQRGLFLESLGRLDQASEAFTACMKVSGTEKTLMNQVRPLLGLCRLAAAKGDILTAAKYARQSALAAPRDPEALVALSMFVALAEGQDALVSLVWEHVEAQQDAAIALAQALLTCGQLNLAQDVLTKTLAQNEEAALGLLLIALIEGRDLDMEINISQEAADNAFQAWLNTLWKSRQPKLVDGFLEHCEAVVGVFPWLPQWLQQLVTGSDS